MSAAVGSTLDLGSVGRNARERFDQGMAWIDARTTRERLLLLAVCLGVVFGIFTLLTDPLRAQGAEVSKSLEEVQAQIAELEAQTHSIMQAHSTDPNAALRDRGLALRQQIDSLDANIEKHTVTMISPPEMARVLEGMLTRETDLRLIRLENLAPEPVLEGIEEVAEAAGAGTGIFKHGFVIELQGGYLSTLRYLQALEELPWNFFWESLEYEVLEHPEGRATIGAYTLGSEEGWVGA